MNTTFTTNMKSAISNWIKGNNKSNGYEMNRSFQARINHAFTSQKRRFGKLTSADTLTVEELIEKIYEQGNCCTMCGQTFNSFDRKNEESYTWEISHVRTPEDGGHMNKGNIQLLHKRCNSVLWQSNINLKKVAEKRNFNCYLDMVRYDISRDNFKGTNDEYRKYVKFINDIDSGYDVNVQRVK